MRKATVVGCYVVQWWFRSLVEEVKEIPGQETILNNGVLRSFQELDCILLQLFFSPAEKLRAFLCVVYPDVFAF